MVFLGMILRFIISKEGKLPNPKKVETIIKMPIPKNLIISKYSMA
jgi:predicted HTH transcriptional regulator